MSFLGRSEAKVGKRKEGERAPELTAEQSAAIENAVCKLARHFKIGPHDVDDLKQEGRLKGWLALPKYKPYTDSGKFQSLANFLFIAIKNHFRNCKRGWFRRTDPPCKLCHMGRPCAEAVCSNRGDLVAQACPDYLRWVELQNAKSSLCCPSSLDEDEEEGGACPNPSLLAVPPEELPAELDEVLARIDRELPVHLREPYLKMREGLKVKQAERDEVQFHVRSILRGVMDCPAHEPEED